MFYVMFRKHGVRRAQEVTGQELGTLCLLQAILGTSVIEVLEVVSAS